LLSCHDHIDTSDVIGEAVTGVVAAMGQRESENISKRVKSKQAENASLGRNHGGRPAYGYTGDRLNAREAAHIREAARRVLRGEGVGTIVADWNRRHIQSPSGGVWHSSSQLRRILVSPRLAGLRTYRGKVIGKATCPAILSESEHRQLQGLLETTTRQGRPASYVTSGLLKCGVCGSRLLVTYTNGVRKWRCAKLPGTDHCGSLTIVAEPVDEVVEFMCQRLIACGVLPAPAPATKRTKKVKSPEQIEDALLALTDLLADGAIPRGKYDEKRSKLTTELAAARSVGAPDPTEALRAEVAGVTNAERYWSGLTLERRQAVASMLLPEGLTILPGTKGSPRTFDPYRIAPPTSIAVPAGEDFRIIPKAS
jgi:hypothetical protein